MDTSAWAGEVPAETFRALRDCGITAFIPQLWGGGPKGTGPNPHLARQVESAFKAGLDIPMGYVWPPGRAEQALAYWNREVGRPLRMLALDVEAGAGVYPDHLRPVWSAGIEPVIYTSRYEWDRLMKATPYYAYFARQGVRLWAAHYVVQNWDEDWPRELNPVVPDPWADQPELLMGWQFAGDLVFGDRRWDLNLMLFGGG